MNKQVKEKGRFLTLLLRHKPEEVNLQIEYIGGWASVIEVLNKLDLKMNELEWIVSNDNKGRFSFNENKSKIRANQGHSIDVDLELKEENPSDILYHGTSSRFLDSILKNGLKPMNRQHVHLSNELSTAQNVGKRHGGELVILTVDTDSMLKDGFKFYLSENKVWLTDKVLPKYLKIKE